MKDIEDIVSIETAVLGCLLNAPERFDVLALSLSETDFSDKDNREVYLAMLKLRERKINLDKVILFDELGDKVTPETRSIFTDVKYRAEILDDYIALLIQKRMDNELLSISEEIKTKIADKVDVDEVISDTIDRCGKLLKFKKRKDIVSFEDATLSALDEIENNAQSDNTYFKSGFPKIDYLYAFRRDTLTLIAGDKQSAKTAFVIALINGICTLNQNIKVVWFSMEDPKEKIIRRLISMRTMLSDRTILSTNEKMTEEKVISIAAAFKNIQASKFDIHFIDSKQNISGVKKICRKMKVMADSEDKDLIIVIDNLGLVDSPGFKEDTAKENHVAGELVGIKEETKAHIFLLHHLTKMNINIDRLKEGYRPREEAIRGSSRIIDYCNQCMLVNRPGKYPDLSEIFKKRAESERDVPDKLELNKHFESIFWPLNKRPDKNTEGLGDLKQATLNKLNNVLMFNDTVFGEEPATMATLFMSYKRYYYQWENKNKGRDDKYVREAVSLYTFLDKRMYQHAWTPAKDSREDYLFGEHINMSSTELYDLFTGLFIVEAAKIRDFGQEVDKIVRFKADLNANIFKII